MYDSKNARKQESCLFERNAKENRPWQDLRPFSLAIALTHIVAVDLLTDPLQYYHYQES